MATFETITAAAIGGGGAGTSYLVASVELTDAQIKALPTTGVEIIAAPGVGKYIEILFARAFLNTVAGAYTAPDATFVLQFPTGGIIQTCPMPAQASLELTQLSNGRFAIPIIDIGSGVYAGFNVAGIYNFTIENQPLEIKDNWNGVSDYTGGNAANTLKVTVYYVIVDL